MLVMIYKESYFCFTVDKGAVMAVIVW